MSDSDNKTGDWSDLDKKNYVIVYAAKLRLHFLEESTD